MLGNARCSFVKSFYRNKKKLKIILYYEEFLGYRSNGIYFQHY